MNTKMIEIDAEFLAAILELAEQRLAWFKTEDAKNADLRALQEDRVSTVRSVLDYDTRPDEA